MKRIVGYARVSSREQAVDSHALEQQIARLKAAGATEIYQDIQSGSNDDRPALKKLIDLVHSQQVDEVIITRIDRKARSLPKLRECIDIYHKSGVNLRILDQQIDLNTSQGKLMVNVLGSLAEWETDLLSERIRHGKEHRRNKRAACESYPWGYQVVNDKYQLDTRLFLCLISDRPDNYLELYNEDDVKKLPGLTIKQIARDCIDIFLQVKGISRALKVIFQKYGITRKHNKRNSRDSILHWTTAGFNNWLTNPVLRGHTAYFQRITISKGKRKKNKPEDWQIIHDTHPEHRLITETEVVEIEQILKFNSKTGHFSFNQDPNNPVCYREYAYQTGLVFCAECGSKCITKSAKHKQGMYYYFACRYADMGCGNKKSTRKSNIENSLIHTLVQRSQTLANELDEQPTREQQKSEKLKQLESRLEALEKIPGFDPDLEKLKEKIRLQITEEINPFLSDSILNKSTEEIIRAGNNLAIWHTLSPDEKVKIYHQIVHQITIRNAEVEEVILKI
ncbi:MULTISPECIES: fdxN element excision recombinase XisF [Nostoc]|uniref:Recombinase family protein n=1 Tax=Nostoc paludosum FACHB-159 TaxID=2692908 RepID=A0ABR8KEX9_9NOSO|nr:MULTISPECIES: fdxN element excision recombinase XisF [Nostoc]MBD2681727.1 recombinase family protein [Nostoc sp. FACHB-857]MBD2738118.1 recombinase family protein [Nostoc paludosum FACHB-159]